MSNSVSNPCLTCGACCAHFRVSFYWTEAEPARGGNVPAGLTLPINPHLIAMKGTDVKPVHCIALQGKVGEEVCCVIYAQRPSTCDGVMVADEKCNKARQAHNLPLLTPSLHA